ncbi:hypothetical protein VS868_11735 [Salinimicrobium sp. 3283s]|uniref:hypothetical protein n=1 Tax=Salinimicrobium sp. 3283s TaxID=3114359 RepID=UPI0031E68DD1
MTPENQKKLYRREIEEAIETLKNLRKDIFYNVPKLSWWLLHYEELYHYAFDNRHNGSCFEGMGCSCSWNNPESRFSDIYSALKEIVDLYHYEKYFKSELETLKNIRNDYPALMQWLKKNEKQGSEDFLLFWIEEWHNPEEASVNPIILNWSDLEIKFNAEEWKYTIEFLEEFNAIYWTSDACPPISI